MRQAFRKLGHDAWSLDLLPSRDGSPWHIQTDHETKVFDVIESNNWDLLIAHPPCTDIAVSGALRFKEKIKDGRQKKAIDFFMRLALSKVPMSSLENPVCIMSTVWRKPNQIIQPYQFGEDASKKTCLWLKNLPHLIPTRYVPPRMVCKCGHVYPYLQSKGCDKCGAEQAFAKPRWANQTDSGQNRLGPSPDRAMIRATTYQGIAEAMATQWGG